MALPRRRDSLAAAAEAERGRLEEQAAAARVRTTNDRFMRAPGSRKQATPLSALGADAVALKLTGYLSDHSKSSSSHHSWCDPLREAYQSYGSAALLLSARRRMAAALGALHGRCSGSALGLRGLPADVSAIAAAS
eukprot:SAG25_NODE_361_length_9156_cov_9.406647_18_plen_136_part_00